MIEILVGLAGLLLIISGTSFVFSSKYYDFFSRTFLIGKYTVEERKSLANQITKNHSKSRIAVALLLIFFGTSALMWSYGFKSALGWPFNGLF